jgi:hypothetical protein
METVPSVMAVTRPVEETVAMSLLDDVHVAVVVTFSVVPFDRFAVAAYCAVAPTAGGAPVTVTVETADGDVAELPHAVVRNPRPTMTRARGMSLDHRYAFRPFSVFLNIDLVPPYARQCAGSMAVETVQAWQTRGGSVKKP